MTQLTLSPQFIDRLSTADTQFRDGNFLAAFNLYTGVLSDISKQHDVERGDVASVVLKVAECSYAAGNFEAARLAYEKLLKIQEDGDSTSNKDRVFTLVKAAKNYEKCNDNVNAQARFEEAYQLAKTALPATHFLRRTVLECYAQWLRASKLDQTMLSILESELGIDSAAVDSTASAGAATESVAKPSAKESEVSADDVELPKTKPSSERKTVQDFNDIKAKLASKKPRVSDTQGKSDATNSTQAGSAVSGTAGAGTIETSQPVDDADASDAKKKGANVFEKSKAEKTLERQIAARKFLNFGSANNVKADRSKLKNVLTDDNAIVSDRDEIVAADTTTSDPHLLKRTQELVDNFDFQEAKKELAIEQANQDLLEEAETLLRNLELAQQQKAPEVPRSPEPSLADGISDNEFLSSTSSPGLRKVIPKVDLQQALDIEALLAESARMIYSLEDKDPSESETDDTGIFNDADFKLGLKGAQDSAMRGSGRSYFGQEIEKEAKPEVETVSDKIDKILDGSKKANKTLKFGVPIIAIAAISALALIGSANMKPDSVAQAPKFVQQLKDKDFSTADDAIALEFKPYSLEIRTNKDRRKPNVYFWQGTTNDEMRLLQGAYKNCIWLHPTKDGLASSDGKVFYSANAPELRLIEIMDSIKTAALGYFSATGHYPNPEQVQPKQFVNPVTQRYENVNISNMVVTKDRPAEAANRMDVDLESGQHFNNEVAAQPGSISVFCVQVGDPLHTLGTEANNYTDSMYIHAYDGKGELLKTGANQKVLLTELKPTGAKSTVSRSEVGAYKDCDICITEAEEPTMVGIAFKYLMLAVLVFGVLGFLVWSQKNVKKDEGTAETEGQ